MSNIDDMTPGPRPRKVLKTFRGSVVVIYWLVLPLALLAAAGWTISLFIDPASPRSWPMATGSILFCGLLIWRLWLNSQALGRAGPLPSPRRFWSVYAPLGLLALVGLCILGLGISGAFVTTALPDVAPDAFPLAIGLSAALIVIGALMCWPILRLLLRKPAEPAPAPEA
ncbi:hypothetical protein [Brevundimonas sp. GCM10030266]|uniref:hypothetical protein n=1 Tax=Brevundimonas sp. GCM10030266 TaxID=3273386 RepID=UPI0036092FF9